MWVSKGATAESGMGWRQSSAGGSSRVGDGVAADVGRGHTNININFLVCS